MTLAAFALLQKSKLPTKKAIVETAFKYGYIVNIFDDELWNNKKSIISVNLSGKLASIKFSFIEISEFRTLHPTVFVSDHSFDTCIVFDKVSTGNEIAAVFVVSFSLLKDSNALIYCAENGWIYTSDRLEVHLFTITADWMRDGTYCLDRYKGVDGRFKYNLLIDELLQNLRGYKLVKNRHLVRRLGPLIFGFEISKSGLTSYGIYFKICSLLSQSENPPFGERIFLSDEIDIDIRPSSSFDVKDCLAKYCSYSVCDEKMQSLVDIRNAVVKFVETEPEYYLMNMEASRESVYEEFQRLAVFFNKPELELGETVWRKLWKKWIKFYKPVPPPPSIEGLKMRTEQAIKNNPFLKKIPANDWIDEYDNVEFVKNLFNR